MLHRRGTVFPLRGRYFKKGNNPLLYRACFAKGKVRKAFLRGSFVTKKHRNASNIMHQTYRNQPSYFNYKDASLQLLIGPRKTPLQSYSSYSNSNSSFFPPRCSGLISCYVDIVFTRCPPDTKNPERFLFYLSTLVITFRINFSKKKLYKCT